MTGRPGWPRRTFQVQNRRKPARCQAKTVAGLTMARTGRQSRQMRDSQNHNIIAESARPVQIVPRTPRAAEVPAPDLAVDVIPVARTNVEPLVLKNDSVLPPETSYQLAVLASQLEALAQPQIRTDSGSTIRMPVATAWEKPVEEQQIAAGHVEIHEEATSEPARLIPLLQRAFPSGRSNSPHRIVRRQIFQSNELFWRTATIFTLPAVLFLLLGTWVHRFSPLAGRLAQVVQQQPPFQRTIAPETSATTRPAAATVVADQPPASEKISSSPQKAVLKPTGLHSAYASGTDIVAEQNTKLASEVQNRIRADRRLQMTQVQVRTRNGLVTLSGSAAMLSAWLLQKMLPASGVSRLWSIIYE